MMNKKQSPLKYVTRYAVLVPLIATPILAFTACSEEPNLDDTNRNVQAQTSAQVKTPDALVYYLDGKEVTKAAVENLDPKEIQSMEVFKGENAIKAYGDKGANGVIEIKTKNNQGSSQEEKRQ